jgi:alpha-L-rhamnosidase
MPVAWSTSWPTISSRWRIEDERSRKAGPHGRFFWQITVPPNTSAEVHVPATDAGNVTESGRPADQAQGVVFLRMEPDRETGRNIRRAIFKLGSGEYEFHSRF